MTKSKTGLTYLMVVMIKRTAISWISVCVGIGIGMIAGGAVISIFAPSFLQRPDWDAQRAAVRRVAIGIHALQPINDFTRLFPNFDQATYVGEKQKGDFIWRYTTFTGTGYFIEMRLDVDMTLDGIRLVSKPVIHVERVINRSSDDASFETSPMKELSLTEWHRLVQSNGNLNAVLGVPYTAAKPSDKEQAKSKAGG